MTPETAPMREVLLDPHVAWAIACLLLALVAAAVALAIGLSERQR
jgi:hypothetical protein